MKKSVVLVIVVVVVLALGTVLLVSHKADAPKPMDTMTDSQMEALKKAQTETNDQKTATNSVTIDNFAFSPANITVKKGTTVTWTNKDSATHTVTETDGQTGPDSGDLATGKSYSFTFDTAGTFKYHCSIHPDMLGTVTVTE